MTTTPVRSQYLRIKKQYPNVIVFFRLGDFYETFDDDAKLVASELDLVLTSRPASKGERIPMAGVPYHAAENYIARLIAKGHKVAICEQTGDEPQDGLMQREVVRVVTPGTVVESNLLEAKRNNYLACLATQGNQAGLAYCDITTGEFAVTQFTGDDAPNQLQRELERLQPAELVVSETSNLQLPNPKSPIPNPNLQLPITNYQLPITPYAAWHFDADSARQILLAHFNVSALDGFGIAGMPSAIGAAGALLQYVRDTQQAALAQLTDLRAYSTERFMLLDAATRRNLELTKTIRGATQGSLITVLDQTLTPMGARLLHTWLNQPLLERDAIRARHDAVQTFFARTPLRAELRQLLKAFGDVERMTNRIVQGVAMPRELLAYANHLNKIPALASLLQDTFQDASSLQESILTALFAVSKNTVITQEVVRWIEAAINSETPATLNEVGVIRKSYSAELDGIAQAAADAKQWVANLEKSERERTGIKTLKVGYNSVFGYYIEISKAAAANAPTNYIRKQTLTNAERFITPELKAYETLILNADERAKELERQLYKQLLSQIAAHGAALLATAHSLAQLDVYVSFAEVAMLNRYVRPTLTDGRELHIVAGRHPVVELSARDEPFVPNDIGFKDGELMVLTGPNMAGKTTYLRQVALIVLMAQVGSFVPADAATIGIVDRIFTRVGAQDDISAGQSTFMVEMVETANILHHATPRSLLILDEIGRGTSTYDGLSIAWAVIEYIHNHPRLQAKTLFATHYHELISLAERLPRVRNFNVAVSEEGGRVTFLRKIVEGGADRSYGIHVAQLAGLPRSIITRAEEILQDLEAQAREPQRLGAAQHKGNAPLQTSLFALSHPMVEELRTLDLAGLSPLEALNRLYQWQSAIKKDEG
jgi:DNA mismatch repair protein MutS